MKALINIPCPNCRERQRKSCDITMEGGRFIDLCPLCDQYFAVFVYVEVAARTYPIRGGMVQEKSTGASVMPRPVEPDPELRHE